MIPSKLQHLILWFHQLLAMPCLFVIAWAWSSYKLASSRCLMVLENSMAGIVLGHPWLISYDPSISWTLSEILKLGEGCFHQCFPSLPLQAPVTQVLLLHSTSIESQVDHQSFDIPAEYSHFREVFCLKCASKLPPHRPWDCAINLLPNEPVPKGKVYPIAILEQRAMEEYMEEASTAPVASSLFFVAKKDGGLYRLPST